MTAEELAWQALGDALEEYPPPCDGLDAFTADSLTEGERAWCAVLCADCLVSDLCDAYAVAAKVKCGFWSGRQYGKNGKRKAPAVDAPQDASPTSTPDGAARTLQDDQPDVEDD